MCDRACRFGHFFETDGIAHEFHFCPAGERRIGHIRGIQRKQIHRNPSREGHPYTGNRRVPPCAAGADQPIGITGRNRHQRGRLCRSEGGGIADRLAQVDVANLQHASGEHRHRAVRVRPRRNGIAAIDGKTRPNEIEMKITA